MFKLRSGQTIDTVSFAAEVDRLQRLATDLMLFADGHVNIDTDAPLLDVWTQSTRNAACLIGKVYNHPTIIGAGRPTMTSDLCLLAEDMGVARTASRWYRLGRPQGSDNSSYSPQVAAILRFGDVVQSYSLDLAKRPFA